jgi:RNA polymerase sigma-70 factor, ECF subfamily
MPDFGGRPACRDFEQVLALARAGDSDARGRLLQYFWLALLRDARRDLPWDLQPKGGASDLVQETMLDAHKDFEQFTGTTGEEFFAWLQCLLRNNFSNFVRAYRRQAKRQVKREVPLVRTASNGALDDRRRFPLSSPSEGVIRREATERYRRAIQQMPEEIRDVIRWRFDERRTYREIGGRLGLTPEAVRKLLTRTLRLLGDELAD